VKGHGNGRTPGAFEADEAPPSLEKPPLEDEERVFPSSPEEEPPLEDEELVF
jgi:hypothetical protein